MAREIDKVFGGEEKIQIASGYISKTNILFEKEGIIAEIDAKGSVKFYDTDENLLDEGSVPSQTGGREVYEEIYPKLDGKSITLSFPVYEWIDNYPNCDGEHDRWSTKTIGYESLTFDLLEKKIVR